MNIEGARILVTGGCGLIGSTTIDQVLPLGPSRIVILDNLSRGTLDNVRAALADPRVTFVEGDIRDAAMVERLAAESDAILHLAALRITNCAADPREALGVMSEGTFNVADAARKAGIRKIVAASSASVYGLADVFPTQETHHPYGNRTWYGALKVLLEGLLRSFHDMYGVPYVALRYFNVYGPRMDIHGRYTEVFVRWMERLDSGQPPLIFGDGTQTMDFVHVDDVARANVAALQSDVVDDVFNVASGVETSLAELAGTLARVMGSSLQPEFGPERAVNPVPRRLADPGKAERLLGFRTRVPLDEGLRGLVAWWRAERKRTA